MVVVLWLLIFASLLASQSRSNPNAPRVNQIDSDYTLALGYADSSGQKMIFQKIRTEIDAYNGDIGYRSWAALDLTDIAWASPAITGDDSELIFGLGLSYRDIVSLDAWLEDGQPRARATASLRLAPDWRLGLSAGSMLSFADSVSLSVPPLCIGIGPDLWGDEARGQFDDGRWKADLSLGWATSLSASNDDRYFSRIPWAAWSGAVIGYKDELWSADLFCSCAAARATLAPASIDYISSDDLLPRGLFVTARLGFADCVYADVRCGELFLPDGDGLFDNSKFPYFIYSLILGKNQLSWSDCSARLLGGALGFILERPRLRAELYAGYDAIALSGSWTLLRQTQFLFFPPTITSYVYDIDGLLSGVYRFGANLDFGRDGEREFRLSLTQYIPVVPGAASSSSGGSTGGWSYGGLVFSLSWRAFP